uniref:Venom protein family 12 protein 1a n=1 Tax=Pristhesancus plagipennis TaxID=1955184 RepID=A0A2K8JRN0_PRIPG|nr:venom protein family 12 protein 1a [Pristhesancus plagipennis]
MYKQIVFSLMVVLLVQGGRCEQQQQQQDFEQLVNNAKQVLDNWAKEIREKIGISADPSGQEIVSVIKQHNEKLAQNLKDTGKKLEDELKSNPNIQSVIEKIKSAFNEEAEKLKKSNPDLVLNAENVGKSLQGTWDSLTQEIEKSYKDFNKAGGKREEIEHTFESLLDKVKAGAKELENKIQEISQKKN